MKSVKYKKQIKQALVAGTALVVFAWLGFWLASIIDNNPVWREFIQNYGVIGMLTVSIFAGLNPFVPVPPATFAPTFLAGGFTYLTIVFFYTIGTTIADSIGFLLGKLGRQTVEVRYPKFQKFVTDHLASHRILLYTFIGCYITFAPLPNELILIPLALAGQRYLPLLPVLIVGNAIHHTLLIYGYDSVFRLFFV